MHGKNERHKKTAKTCMGGHVGGVLCGIIINKMNVKNLNYALKGKTRVSIWRDQNLKEYEEFGVDEMHKLWAYAMTVVSSRRPVTVKQNKIYRAKKSEAKDAP